MSEKKKSWMTLMTRDQALELYQAAATLTLVAINKNDMSEAAKRLADRNRYQKMAEEHGATRRHFIGRLSDAFERVGVVNVRPDPEDY
ncbi:MAG: hypothetical protein AAB573_04120 [Patescibacteria group bacterium]